MTKTIEEISTELNTAFDARLNYETAKNAENVNIVKTINNVRKSMTHATIAQVLLSSNYDAASINRAERVNARRNVYSIEKDDNIARTIAKVELLNHYTLAILKTAIALEQNDMLLTHKDAASACSLDVKISDATREKIIALNKYAKHIAANTASTQSSSSINALVAMNVLIETRDAAAAIAYSVNKKSFAAKKLIASFV